LIADFVSLFGRFISLFTRVGSFPSKVSDINNLEVDDRARNEPGTTFSQYFPVDQATRTLRLAHPIRWDPLSIDIGSAPRNRPLVRSSSVQRGSPSSDKLQGA
jgi:hypothetical protein